MRRVLQLRPQRAKAINPPAGSSRSALGYFSRGRAVDAIAEVRRNSRRSQQCVSCQLIWPDLIQGVGEGAERRSALEKLSKFSGGKPLKF